MTAVDMQYRNMGRSGLKVSAITLGTLWFGAKIDGQAESIVGRALEGLRESLRRLQTDYVDLYYLHGPDYSTPLEESLRAVPLAVDSPALRSGEPLQRDHTGQEPLPGSDRVGAVTAGSEYRRPAGLR